MPNIQIPPTQARVQQDVNDPFTSVIIIDQPKVQIAVVCANTDSWRLAHQIYELTLINGLDS